MRKYIYLLSVIILQSCVVQDGFLTHEIENNQDKIVESHNDLSERGKNPYQNMSNMEFMTFVENSIDANPKILQNTDIIIQAIWNTKKGDVEKDYLSELQREDISLALE